MRAFANDVDWRPDGGGVWDVWCGVWMKSCDCHRSYVIIKMYKGRKEFSNGVAKVADENVAKVADDAGNRMEC